MRSRTEECTKGVFKLVGSSHVKTRWFKTFSLACIPLILNGQKDAFKTSLMVGG